MHLHDSRHSQYSQYNRVTRKPIHLINSRGPSTPKRKTLDRRDSEYDIVRQSAYSVRSHPTVI